VSALDKDSGTQVPLTDRDRIGWAAGQPQTSSGSISTLPLTEPERAELEDQPRQPIGFA
jgi:hypothetical protein